MAFIYCLLFNSPIFFFKFTYYKATFFKAFLELGKDFIYIYLLSFIFFFGLAIQRTVFIAGSVFLFLSGALASYYLFFFKISPSLEIMKAFFASEFNETYELLSTRLIIWLIFSIFVCIYTIKHFGINTTNLFISKILSAICLLLALNAVIAPPYKVFKGYFPVQYLHNSYLYFIKDFGNGKRVSRSDITEKFQFIDNAPQDIIGVIVIGESARFDHFSLNGYARQTNPFLEDIGKSSNPQRLFSYKAHSCSNITYISVPCMFSRHTGDNIDEVMNENGFLAVLTKLGFNTRWIGTQSMMKYFHNANLGTIYQEVDFALLPGGSALFQMNDQDEVMLPYIKDWLKKEEKSFLVVHTSGSHWNYALRYPVKFAKFQPVCNALGKSDPTSCGQEGLINIYDNSILYTDFFLSNLINLLKDKTAFLIYVSDHAESLGEAGRYMHGGDLIPEQTTIPFIVWVSDKLVRYKPMMVESLASYLDYELSHDYVFHSVLDCLGVESGIIDKKLSLCRYKQERVND